MSLRASGRMHGRLVELFGAARLAKELGLPRSTVQSWKERGIPVDRIDEVRAAVMVVAKRLREEIERR